MGGKLPDIEIKRGYEILSNNNIKFGIRVINNGDLDISDVEVILDQNESLFDLESNKIQYLGTLSPTIPGVAKFILRPKGCVHKENIRARIIFKDLKSQKYTLEMRPKEVHCIYPFLKEKYITRTEFLTLAGSGYSEERGVNFEEINVDKLMDILLHTCRKRLYNVDETSIENGMMVYLAGDVIGEKAYYLLTAVVKEYKGMTQILLRANSDNQDGADGFLNEILDNLRHPVVSAGARETGIIKKEQVINVIDPIPQKSSFFRGEGQEQREEKEGESKKEIETGENERQKERVGEDSQIKREKEIWRIMGQKKERAKIEPKAKSSLRKKFLAALVVLVILAVGYIVTMPGPDTGQTNFIITQPHTVNVEIKGFKFNPVELRIVKGTKVTWTNTDSALHIIKGDDFTSSGLNERDVWSYTFDKKGTFNYSCLNHPYIPQGKIIVTD